MYKCWVDGEACEAVAPIAGLVDEGAIDCLPCYVCRAAERHAAALSGLRLGRHERRVLLEALPPRDWGNLRHENSTILPENDTRSAREALRRALRRLHEAGLVQRMTQHAGGEGNRVTRAIYDEYGHLIPGTGRYGPRQLVRTSIWCERMAARLTPLGAALVDLARKDLQGGDRIRWARYQQAAIAAARMRGEALLSEFRALADNDRVLYGLLRQREASDRAAAVVRAIDSVLPSTG